MSWLVDTNVVSELRKGARCHPSVAAWSASVDDDELYVSVLTIGELRRGVEMARPRDPEKANALQKWLEELTLKFQGRVISIDTLTAAEWGRLTALRTVPVVDALLAATARVNGMTLVTRNSADVKGLGVEVLDPFMFEA